MGPEVDSTIDQGTVGFTNKLIKYTSKVCNSCSTAVEHMPRNQEVIISNPPGCRAFFSSVSFSHSVTQWCVLNRVPRGSAFFRKKWLLSCVAWGETSLISTGLAKEDTG